MFCDNHSLILGINLSLNLWAWPFTVWSTFFLSDEIKANFGLGSSTLPVCLLWYQVASWSGMFKIFNIPSWAVSVPSQFYNCQLQSYNSNFFDFKESRDLLALISKRYPIKEVYQKEQKAVFRVRRPGTPPLSLLRRHSWFHICSSFQNEARGESRGQISADWEKSGPRDPPTLSNFLKKYFFVSLELPFKIADVLHPGQVWKERGWWSAKLAGLCHSGRRIPN